MVSLKTVSTFALVAGQELLVIGALVLQVPVVGALGVDPPGVVGPGA